MNKTLLFSLSDIKSDDFFPCFRPERFPFAENQNNYRYIFFSFFKIIFAYRKIAIPLKNSYEPFLWFLSFSYVIEIIIYCYFIYLLFIVIGIIHPLSIPAILSRVKGGGREWVNSFKGFNGTVPMNTLQTCLVAWWILNWSFWPSCPSLYLGKQVRPHKPQNTILVLM